MPYNCCKRRWNINMKTLKNSKQIKSGHFYKSGDYYYIGAKFGNKKVLFCLNMEQKEVNQLDDDDKNAILPEWLMSIWNLVECSQEEVIKNL